MQNSQLLSEKVSPILNEASESAVASSLSADATDWFSAHCTALWLVIYGVRPSFSDSLLAIHLLPT